VSQVPEDAEKRIAAAVQRRAALVGSGSGSGAAGPGGPISSGGGSGAGGTPTDLQYVLYHGRMVERIKAAWAWAGADRSLRTVVQFNVTADGEVRDVRTIEPSGDPSYDASAERAVRAVNPLDPVPERFRDVFANGFELVFLSSDLEQ
jgi:colicin import membrane protein